MIVSPPRINLRKAASYTHDKGPLSSTSSRFNFNHLVFSPPPSPSLPALLPRPPRPSSRPRPSRVARLAVWILGAIFLFYVAASFVRRSKGVSVLNWNHHHPHDQYEMVGQEDFPDFPTPIVVTDKRGKARWTVYIPPNQDFPLAMAQYSDICEKCREVSCRVKDLRSGGHGIHSIGLGGASADGTDHYFLDVADAEKSGLLPVAAIRRRPSGSAAHDDGHLVGDSSKGGRVDKPLCARSMTFVLETSDAGMGKTLMMLWMAYGLAKREDRAFFIDDTRWAYGDYTEIFKPPPFPSCRPPPRNQMLPCPRQSQHLVASAATAIEFFGDMLSGDEGFGYRGSEQLQEEFELAREGYTALFRLNEQDNDYVDTRVRELKSKTLVPKTRGKQDGIIVGVHVRHGDRHPAEFQYRESYVPMNLYTEKAREVIEDRFNLTGAHGEVDTAAKAHSRVVLASDDPVVYESDEFARVSRAQERIKLASKAAIQQVNPDRNVMHKFIDETFGWEGGFFAPMFWNLGLSTVSAASAAQTAVARARPSDETIRLRSLVGRAYMMDLAVLADSGDVVVCTVSAMGCRLLAVMMGWERAIEGGHWINIDGDYSWMAV